MIDTNIAKNFNDTLIEKGLTIVCAESVTAGLLASTIASVSGASSVLKGSIVTYAADLKTKILGVDPLIISKNTAESQETTDAMCLGLKELYPEASIQVSVTGVASKPADDTYKIDKVVGQIYVTIFYEEKLYRYATVITPKNEDDRNSIRMQAVVFIIERVLDTIAQSLGNN